MKKICKVEGCSKNYKGKGYCSKHYQQYRKYGVNGVDKIVWRLAWRFAICKNPECLNEYVAHRKNHFYCCSICRYSHYESSDIAKERKRKYNISDKGLTRHKEYRQKNPLKMVARKRAKKMLDSQFCVIEGCDIIGERHHPDYSKPLDVIFLCRKHHMDLHCNRLAYSIIT